jgi:hypothetical protein
MATLAVGCAVLWAAACGAQASDASWTPKIPRTWDEAALESLELPLPRPGPAHRSVSAEEYYYEMPVRPIYKSYPVYHPAHEPTEYLSWLQQQKPQITFDTAKLRTQQDWINAGALVFDAPIDFMPSSSTAFR